MTIAINQQESNKLSNGGGPSSPVEDVDELLWSGAITLMSPDSSFDDFTFLTPEALMDFVELKLQKADSELLSHMKDIDARRKLVEQLNTLAGEVKALTASGKGINSADLKKGAEGMIEVCFDDPILGSKTVKTFPNTPEGMAQAEKLSSKLLSTKVTPGDPAKAAQYEGLIKKYEELANTATSMGKGDLAAKLQGIANDIKAGKSVSKETLEDGASAIEAAANELTSSADMTMLKMQTLMQDRSRVLTWVTNAIKAMTEPQDQMARNIG